MYFNKPQTACVKSTKKECRKPSVKKSKSKKDVESVCSEMKSIMTDWHKPVYHKSSFTVSSDMVTERIQTQDEKTMCRICQSLDDTIDNQQVSPCACSGSLQYVHTGCLRQWRLAQEARGHNVSCCELCKQPYNIELLGDTNVIEDNLMKVEKDLKQLVKSTIYMMLLLRSKKQDLMQLYEQSRTRSPNSSVCSNQPSSGQSSQDIESIEEFENFIKESLQTHRLSLSSFPSTANLRSLSTSDTTRFDTDSRGGH